MKIITINHYQVHMTLNGGYWIEDQGHGVSDGHRNLMDSIAPEPLKTFEPKLTQLSTVELLTDEVFKVIGLKVKVTDTFCGRGIPIDNSPSTFI